MLSLCLLATEHNYHAPDGYTVFNTYHVYARELSELEEGVGRLELDSRAIEDYGTEQP